MASPAERLERSERLRRSRDFQRVARSATRVASQDFVLLVSRDRPTGVARRRLGITASRKVGRAVARNRVKRSVREWFRRNRDELSQGVDVVVIARPGAARLSGASIAADLSALAVRSRRAGSRPPERRDGSEDAS